MKFECVYPNYYDIKLGDLKVGTFFKPFGSHDSQGLFLKTSKKTYLDIDQDAMVIPVEITEVKYKI